MDGAAGDDASSADDDDDDDYVPAATTKKFEKKKRPPMLSRKGGKKRKVTTEEKSQKLDDPKEMTKLPGTSNFWTTDLKPIHKSAAASSSDDDDDAKDDGKQTKMFSLSAAKRPKLSTADRFRVARTEESRVRCIEESYANDDAQPTTVDHFERSVMATPNSSLAWINYMVFHMQSSEIHKARLVARKAIKKISFREAEELLNVWVALLNLELRYGDPEQFDAALVEALQVNDQFKVYCKCVAMLADVKQVDRLTEMLLKFTQKFKTQPECWSTAAAAYFQVGLAEKAQQLLNRALMSLPDRDREYFFFLRIFYFINLAFLCRC